MPKQLDSFRVDEGLPARLRPILTGSRAVDDLAAYFADEGAITYSGRWFECIGGPGDGPDVADRFTGADIVALSTLSVRVPAVVSWRLLCQDADDLSALLSAVPAEVDLWAATDEQIGPQSRASVLWHRLRGMSGKGGDEGTRWVTAGKLLARKRPRLIPIYDKHVRQVAALSEGASWWASLRATLTDDTLVEQVRELGQQAGVPQHVSVLRTLDVVLWMHGKRSTNDVADHQERR